MFTSSCLILLPFHERKSALVGLKEMLKKLLIIHINHCKKETSISYQLFCSTQIKELALNAPFVEHETRRGQC